MNHYFAAFKLPVGVQLLCNGPICVDFLSHFHMRLEMSVEPPECHAL